VGIQALKKPCRSILLFVAIVGAAGAAGMQRRPTASPIQFENAIESSGIDFILDNSATPQKHQIETMMAGVAALDFDDDGFLDLYFANGSRLPAMDKSDPKFYNRLYRNRGDGTFTDVTMQAGVQGQGYAMGLAAADYDNDGLTDIFVAGVDRNHLFHNNGEGSFSDLTSKAGLEGIHPKYGKTYAVSAGWFDYDNDGWLDLFLVNYLNWSLGKAPSCEVRGIRAYCSPRSFEGQPNMLFHNNGNGTFTDVSEASGIGRHIGKGMGVAFADYNGDGRTDIFVANDTFRNFLFRNDGGGKFSEVGVVSGAAYNENGKSIAGMGADSRDVDNDGKPDLWVVAMIGDTFPLFRNAGGEFLDITTPAGLAAPTLKLTAWGNGIYDFDNDGWKDLFAATGAILDNSEQIDELPYRLPNLLLRNQGDGSFRDLSRQAGKGFSMPAAHRGSAAGDFNNDGRIDLVTTNLNGRPELLLNRSPAKNHWLILKLIGRGNRDGIGARIKVVAGKLTQYNHVTTSVGYSSSSDPRTHFGLGAASVADSIEILWPNGSKQTLRNIQADRILTVRQKEER